jgi:hypothetical protein
MEGDIDARVETSLGGLQAEASAGVDEHEAITWHVITSV